MYTTCLVNLSDFKTHDNSFFTAVSVVALDLFQWRRRRRRCGDSTTYVCVRPLRVTSDRAGLPVDSAARGCGVVSCVITGVGWCSVVWCGVGGLAWCGRSCGVVWTYGELCGVVSGVG